MFRVKKIKILPALKIVKCEYKKLRMSKSILKNNGSVLHLKEGSFTKNSNLKALKLIK